MKKLKLIASYVRLITCLLLHRNFGNIVYDIVQKYENIDEFQLRKLERLSIKTRKAELDIKFLRNCKIFNVITKFLSFNLPYTNEVDSKFIRKRLLRSALNKRQDELKKLQKDHAKILQTLTMRLSSVNLYILKKCIRHNVEKVVNNVISTHEKKLKDLTKNMQIPFTSDETIKNLSSYKLTEEEAEILKYGLKHPIEPKHLLKTDILATFEQIHRSLSRDLKDERNPGELKAMISNLANVYWSSYKPTQNTLRKHGILKKLRTRKDIVIVRPDKGSGVVILDRDIYDRKILEIINDTTKFKKVKDNPMLTREGQL